MRLATPLDFGICLDTGLTHLSKQMERGGFVECETGNPIWTTKRDIQRHTPAVGVAHEVNFIVTFVD